MGVEVDSGFALDRLSESGSGSGPDTMSSGLGMFVEAISDCPRRQEGVCGKGDKKERKGRERKREMGRVLGDGSVL